MNWAFMLILVYITALLQVGLAGVLRWGESLPNLLLILLIFIALHVPAEAALVLAVLLGLMFDLTVQTPPGLGVISFGLLGLLLVQLRPMLYKDHPLSHIAMALVCGTLLPMFMLLLQWFRGFFHTPDDLNRVSASGLLGGMVLTTLLAAPGILLLRRFRKPLGLKAIDFDN